MHGGQPVAEMHGRQQALLTYLVLNRRQPLSRQHLAGLFWPDSDDSQALTNLRRELHTLRRALPYADRLMAVEPGTLRWTGDAPATCDVLEFEAAIERGDVEGLREAMRVYRGALLPDCYEDWIGPERERLHTMAVDALRRLTTALEEQRAYPEAIRYARRLLAMDPLDESTHRKLMRLHALQGERAAALHAYHSCATILERELGVAPEVETRAIFERLLDAREHQSRPPWVSAPPLVGRDREWAALLSTWNAAAEGNPRMVVIRGEAGIGKTRLAEELMQWCAKQGVAAGQVRAYPGAVRLTFAPVADLLRSDAVKSALCRLERPWLTELARLLPELTVEHPGLPAPDPLIEGWQRRRFLEALTRAVLSAPQPLLLVLDDLQWCDQDTLEWLYYLMERRLDGRFLVVGTLRTEEAHDNPGLSTLLVHMHHVERLVVMDLGPLGEADTGHLAAHVVGRALDPAAVARLFRQTEGHPLFVVETVRAGVAELSSLTPKVQAVIAARLARLSPGAREVARLAACIGRDFSIDILAHATDFDEETLIAALDELWQRRIVREHGAYGYDFSHDRLREVAYTEIPPASRRVLHKRIAQAVALIHDADLDAVSLQLATHHERAGQTVQARQFYRRAAERAAALYANASALEHYSRVLELAPPSAERFAVCERLGDLLGTIGQRETALEHYNAVLKYYERMNDPCAQARLLRKVGGLYWTAGDRARALGLFQEGLNLLRGRLEHIELAHLYQEMGRLAFRSGENNRAVEWAEQALAQAKRVAEGLPATTPSEAGDRRKEVAVAVAHAYNTLGVALARLGKTDEAVAHIERSVAAADEAALVQAACRGFANLGVLYSTLDPARAIDTCTRGLELAKKIGDAGFESRLYANLALAYCALTNRCDETGLGAAQAAIDLDRRLGQLDHLAVPLIVLAQIYQCHGDPGRALDHYREAMAIAEEVGEPQLLFPCYDGLATLYLEAGDDTQAEHYLLKAQEVCERAGLQPDALVVLPFLD